MVGLIRSRHTLYLIIQNAPQYKYFTKLYFLFSIKKTRLMPAREDTVFAQINLLAYTVFARISMLSALAKAKPLVALCYRHTKTLSSHVLNLLAVYNASLYFLPWKITFPFISGAAKRHGSPIVQVNPARELWLVRCWVYLLIQ